MAVTRINNNQITDASSGNAYVGVNATSKLQNYTITSQKIANNLTYGSDLTVTGNLTVNGTTTTIDTVNTLVKDPLITLADGQTSGTPVLDIGTIGLRGSENSAVMAWKESQLEFVTALSNTTVSNTTFTISSYANLHTGNFIAQGTTSLIGNLIGAVNATGTITGGNLATPGTASATGTVTGGNLATGGTISGTGNITGGNILTGGIISAAGNVYAPRVLNGGSGLTIDAGFPGYIQFFNSNGSTVLIGDGGNISAIGNITSAANIAGGNISASGNITATNFFGNISGNIDAAGSNTQVQFNDGDLLGASTGFTFDKTANLLTVTGNVAGGNLLTGGIVSSTGNITGGNISAGSGIIQTTGNINGGNLNATTGVRATTGYFTGNVDVLGNLNATIGIVYANSGIFYGNAITGNGAAYAGVPGFTPLNSNVVMQFGGNVNSYSQLNFENINNGTQASTDFVLTADNGTDSTNFVNLGIAGSGWNGTQENSLGNALTADDAYLYSHDGNLVIGAAVSGDSVKILAGGSDNTYVRATVSSSGLAVVGVVSANGNVTGGNLLTGGLISSTGTITSAATITGGNLATGGTASATGNITGGNVLTGGQVSATGNVTGGNVNTNNIVGTGLTITSVGALNLAPTGNITANSKNINNLAEPVQDQDAATKAYVDSVAQGLDIKASVVYATTTNLPAYTYNNGTSGVGATLTAQAVGNLTLDGTVVSSGQRVLIKNEVGAFVDNTTQSAAFNGIYTVTTAGSPSVAYVLTRTTDFDSGSPSGEIPGAFTFVEHGATEADTGWVCTTNAPVTVGTTQITWAQFSGAGSYTAGAGLSLAGSQFNVLTDGNANPTTAINGSNQVVVPPGAAFTTPNIGAATGTSLSATGTVTGGNLATAGTISGTGNITGGNVLTGGLISVAGGVTSASVAGGVITGTSTSVTGSQTAASTVGGVITGTSTSVTGGVTAASVAGGVITGTSSSVTGAQTAASTVGGVITGSSVSVTGTVTAASTVGGVITGTSASLSGNVTAANFFGNISGNIDAAGSNTQVQFNDTGDLLGASAGFTFDKTANLLTVTGNVAGGNLTTGGQVSATANITAGNVLTGGLISSTGTITGSSLLGSVVSASGTVTGGNLATGGTVSSTGNITGGNILTGGLVSSTGTITSATTITGGNLATGGTASATGNITGGNILTGGLISSTGNIDGGNVIATSITGGNIVISGDNITDTNGRVNFNTAGADVDFAVNADTVANVFYIDAGTGTASFGSATQTTNAIVAFNATNSIKIPVGNVGQRPATGVTGMVRFNSTNNNLEVYDNSQWSAVGVPSFTVIADQQFAGDDVTVAFTLSSTQTTNSCIVSINGVVQIPTIAYSVAGTDPSCVLTFTEAPSAGDIIDVREITTTTSVTSISNSSGNAVVAVSDTSATTTITGDLIVTGNATITGNVATNQIQNGSSAVQIPTPNGNVYFDINGANDVATISQYSLVMAGNILPTANITYNLGSTTQRWKDLWLSNSTIYMGNAQISANATALIFTNPSGGQTVLAGASASITGASVSVTGTVTAASVVGGVITGSSTSVTGAQTAASTVGGVITGSSVSVTGAVTGASVVGGVITGSSTSVTGTTTAASVVGGVITGSSVSVSGSVTGGAHNGTSVSVSGGVTAASVSGGVITGSSSSVTGTQSAASTVGGVITGTSTSVTGTTTAASVVGGVITGTSVSVSGSVTGGAHNGTSVSVSGGVTAASVSGGVITGTSTSVTGGVTAASVAGGVITGSSASLSGAVTGASLTTAGTLTVNSGGATIAIVNGSTDGIGNIGTSGDGFNTVFAKATSAQYADLAEKYSADAEYAPGTVLVFGGTAEVTVDAVDSDRRVAGVVSTNPAYIMNDRLATEQVATVALTGRVPCFVIGPVRKGDLMVAAGLGRARAEADPRVGTVIGKALEDFDGVEGTIEVVVGRF